MQETHPHILDECWNHPERLNPVQPVSRLHNAPLLHFGQLRISARATSIRQSAI